MYTLLGMCFPQNYRHSLKTDSLQIHNKINSQAYSVTYAMIPKVYHEIDRSTKINFAAGLTVHEFLISILESLKFGNVCLTLLNTLWFFQLSYRYVAPRYFAFQNACCGP